MDDLWAGKSHGDGFSPILLILGSVRSTAIGRETCSIFSSVGQAFMPFMDVTVKTRQHPYGTAVRSLDNHYHP